MSALIYGQSVDKSVGKEIRIDPTYARGGASSFFFDEVNFIPLETTKNSFFGQIDKLIVTKEFYIILDHETDAILIFKTDGAFYTKIVRIPGITKKREEWQAKPSNIFNNFSIDVNTNTILVSTPYAKGKLFLFGFNGIFLNKTYAVPQKTEDYISIGDGLIATRPSRPYLTESNNGEVVFDTSGYAPFSLIIVNKDSSIVQKLFPINNSTAPKENESLGRYLNFSYSGTPGKVFFKRFFDYSFYEVSSMGVEEKYSLVFPYNKSLPNNYFSDSDNNRREYFKKQGIYLSINDIYKVENIFSFYFSVFGAVSENKANILYNEKSGNSVFLGDIKPDSTTYFLNPTKLTSKILACDNKYFYSSLSSLDMHESKKSIKKTSFNRVLNEYFHSSNHKSNPVIVQLLAKDIF